MTYVHSIRVVSIPLAVASLLFVMVASCAARTDPDVEALRVTYLRASTDPVLRTNAAQDLSAMDTTLRQAEEVAARGGDPRQVDHLLYMARRQYELAQTRAAYAQARQQIAEAGMQGRTTVREQYDGVSPPHDVDRVVSVTQRSTSDGTVSGQLTNHSSSPIRDVEMMIRYEWFWANETHPGDFSPGRTDRYEFPDRIAPGQTVAFTYTPTAPLPQRNDGHFEVKIRPIGFVELPN
jgi:hypothetical protein